MYVYKFTLGSLNSLYMFIIDENINKCISGSANKASNAKSPMKQYSDSCLSGNLPSVDMSSDEMKNIALIMDVKLPVRVRIGRKKNAS